MSSRLLSLVLVLSYLATASWSLVLDNSVPVRSAFYIVVWDPNSRTSGPQWGMNLDGLKVLSSPGQQGHVMKISSFSMLAPEQLFYRQDKQIRPATTPNMALDNQGGNNGDKIIIWPAGVDSKTNQQFEVSQDGSLYCLCSNNPRYGYVNEGRQEVYLSSGKTGRHTFVAIPVMIYLYNPATNRYISSTGKAEPWNANHGSQDASKQWFLIPSVNAPGYFSLVPRNNPSMCLDIKGSVDNHEMIMWKKGDPEQKNQIFRFDHATRSIFNDLNSKKERRVLTVDSADGSLDMEIPSGGYEGFWTWQIFQGDHLGPKAIQLTPTNHYGILTERADYPGGRPGFPCEMPCPA